MTANIASDQNDHPEDDTRAGSLLVLAGESREKEKQDTVLVKKEEKKKLSYDFGKCMHFRGNILLLLPRFYKFKISFYKVKYYTVSSMLYNNAIKKMSVCLLFRRF